MTICICCGAPKKFSIILAVGVQGSKVNETDRYYVPNEAVRDVMGTGMDPTEEIAFCGSCIRKVEDAMRATILYIQAEHDRVKLRPIEPSPAA